MSEFAVVEARIQLPASVADALWGPPVSDRVAYWRACRENLAIARRAFASALESRTPAAHYAAVVRHLMEAHRLRVLARETR